MFDAYVEGCEIYRKVTEGMREDRGGDNKEINW